MIKPAMYNITAYQGATYDISLTYKIDDVPVDLTGFEAAMQVRETPSASTAIVSLTHENGIALGGTAGTIQLTIPASTMGSASAGNYQYDLELDTGSSVIRLMQGKFVIEAEVTR